MAKTYFKAQPTAAETQINWAEVGKNFSDMLTEEARVREEKKAAIDEASRQYQQTLNDVEQGQSATANQWWLNAAGEMQQQMLMQDRMLKSGMLNPRDYTVMRQNLVDGTDGLINVFGKFNAEFEDRMNRFENGESQDLEQWAMAELENFGNFQKTSVVVNPETGMLSVADVDEEGNIINDPDKVRSVTSLQNLIARRYDKFDVDAAASTFVEGVGTFDTIERTLGTRLKKGVIQKLSDPFVKSLSVEDLMALGMTEADAAKYAAELNIYKAGEDQLVSDIMSVWSNTSSILTNTMSFEPTTGKEYTFTFKEEGRAANEILLKKDGQGQIYAEYTKEQEKAVADAIRDNVRNRLDRTIEASTVSDYTPPTYKPAGLIKQEKENAKKAEFESDIYTNLAKVYYSDEEADIKNAERALRSIDPSIVNMSRTDTGVTITKQDESRNFGYEYLDFAGVDGVNNTQTEWVASAINYFLPGGLQEITAAEAAKRAGIEGEGQLAPALFGSESEVVDALEVSETGYENTLEQVAREGMKNKGNQYLSGVGPIFEKDKEADTEENIQRFFNNVAPGLPFTTKQAGADIFGTDIVELYYNGKLLRTFKLDDYAANSSREQELVNMAAKYYLDYYGEDRLLRDFGEEYEEGKQVRSKVVGTAPKKGEGGRSKKGQGIQNKAELD